jgi:hypothetical protein
MDNDKDLKFDVQIFFVKGYNFYVQNKFSGGRLPCQKGQNCTKLEKCSGLNSNNVYVLCKKSANMICKKCGNRDIEIYSYALYVHVFISLTLVTQNT